MVGMERRPHAIPCPFRGVAGIVYIYIYIYIYDPMKIVKVSTSRLLHQTPYTIRHQTPDGGKSCLV